MVTAALVIVENVAAADVVTPIATSSIVPPLISAVVIVASVNDEVPVAVTPLSFSNTPSTVTPASSVFSSIVSAVIPPAPTEAPPKSMPAAAMILLLNVISPLDVNASTVSALNKVVALRFVNLPVDATALPIAVLSMAPPFKSTVSESNVVNVPAADVVPPTVTPSIAEPAAPSTSSTPSTSSVLPAPTVIS